MTDATTIDIAANRQVVLDVLRDPELEDWHIQDNYFSVDGPKCEEPTDCNPPALKACYACALGFCALALGFDQFELVLPRQVSAVTGRANLFPEPVYYWNDDDAVRFVEERTEMSDAMQNSIITLNDQERWSLASIADWMEQAWNGQTSQHYESDLDDDDDYEPDYYE